MLFYGNHFNGYSVKKTNKGLFCESWSNVQGELTGYKKTFYYCDSFKKTESLDEISKRVKASYPGYPTVWHWLHFNYRDLSSKCISNGYRVE